MADIVVSHLSRFMFLCGYLIVAGSIHTRFKKVFLFVYCSLVALPGVYYASLLPDEGNGWRINGCIGAGDIDWSSIIWRWIFGL